VLKGHPRFAGKRIFILNFAQSGYKQPQQLQILAYRAFPKWRHLHKPAWSRHAAMIEGRRSALSSLLRAVTLSSSRLAGQRLASA